MKSCDLQTTGASGLADVREDLLEDRVAMLSNINLSVLFLWSLWGHCSLRCYLAGNRFSDTNLKELCIIQSIKDLWASGQDSQYNFIIIDITLIELLASRSVRVETTWTWLLKIWKVQLCETLYGICGTCRKERQQLQDQSVTVRGCEVAHPVPVCVFTDPCGSEQYGLRSPKLRKFRLTRCARSSPSMIWWIGLVNFCD